MEVISNISFCAVAAVMDINEKRQFRLPKAIYYLPYLVWILSPRLARGAVRPYRGLLILLF